VVGAGPAGNNAALGLAQRGYAVSVIESRQTIGDKLCTGILGRECVVKYPLSSDLIYRGASSARVVTPNTDITSFSTTSPKAFIVDRAAYVASFAQKAEQLGVNYRLEERVSRISIGDKDVKVVTNRGNYRARALALASGFGSPLVRQLGFPPPADFVSAVQAVVQTSGVDGVEVHVGSDVAPGFFSWLVPTLPDTALVGLLARRSAREYLSHFIQRLKDDGKVIDVIQEPACWGVPLRPVKRTYQDRALVIGDAAGQVKPTTGGGIYYSLLASEMAVNVLDKALETDDLSAQNLSRYQKHWKTLLSVELETGYSARRLFEFLSDQQITALVKQADCNDICGELDNESSPGFDWHSGIIHKVMAHPAMGSVLRIMNPMLAKIAHRQTMDFDVLARQSHYTDPLAKSLI